MAFTYNNNLENQVAGQADWDTSLNSNFTILDRGFHIKAAAGTAISTGAILWAASGGALFPYNSRSLSLRTPVAMAYKAVASGETDYFLSRGVVSSCGIWSGNIIPGEPVYASPSTAGFAVKSFTAAAYPAGIALRNESILFAPGMINIQEKITQVQSLGPLAIGSTHHATINIGHRGFVRKLEAVTSYNLWTLKFYSGSAAVNSELLFESQSGGVTSTYLLDAAGFPYENTDTASPGLVFAKITVNSGVGSAYFNVTVTGERFR
jgi:hypothetical protein